MTSEQLQQLMIDNIRGDLSPREEKRLQEYLAAHPEAREEMDELAELWTLMDSYETGPLTDDARSRISASLPGPAPADRTATGVRYSFRTVAAAASILIMLGIGYLAYRYLNRDTGIRNTRQTQVSLFTDSNAGSRIQSIQKVAAQPRLTRQTKEAFLDVLNRDPNQNVRLMALETLLEYADDPGIRESLLTSIDRQESPHVQLAMIHAALQWGDATAIPYLDKLLENPETDGYIKQRIRQTIIKLR